MGGRGVGLGNVLGLGIVLDPVNLYLGFRLELTQGPIMYILNY